MADRLPDEMVKEILSLVLAVPDDMFVSRESVSPFLRYDNPSSSIVLEICKQWLRVATPLLYHVVVVCSKGQAKALDRTFRANKALGLFVKKLRLEGGYGASMRTIILATPHVTDVFLTLPSWSDETVSGLCRSMSSLDPVRFILHDPVHRKNIRPINQVVEKLCECIPKWKKLKTFDSPLYTDPKKGRPIINALQLSRTLEKLHTPFDDRYYLVDSLDRLKNIVSLKTIIVSGMDTAVRDDILGRYELASRNSFREEVAADVKLRKLVRYHELHSDKQLKKPSVAATEITARDLSFVPLASASTEERNAIWTKVITFAMAHDGLDNQEFRAEKIGLTRRSLPLVSKEFNRLSRPALYAHLRYFNLRLLANRFILDPSLGHHVRSFYLTCACDDDPKDIPILEAIVALMPNLQQLRSINDECWGILAGLVVETISWNTFEGLAKTAGSSLLKLRAIKIADDLEGPQIRSPAVFEHFARLRNLEWRSCTKFTDRVGDVSSQCLATLERLDLFECNETFLNMLTHMSLPSLRRVSFVHVSNNLSAMENFLRTHGGKLRQLEIADFPIGTLDACSALPVLEWKSSGAPDPSHFICKAKHRSLVKINVTPDWTADFHSETLHEEWMNFFKHVDWSCVPALREIYFEPCNWPTNERDFAKDFWVRAAEYMLQWNVRLTDRHGRGWKPRLK